MAQQQSRECEAPQEEGSSGRTGWVWVWQRGSVCANRGSDAALGLSLGINIHCCIHLFGVFSVLPRTAQNWLQSITRLLPSCCCKMFMKKTVLSFVLHPKADTSCLSGSMFSLSFLCVQWVLLVCHQMFPGDPRAQGSAAWLLYEVCSPCPVHGEQPRSFL